MTASVPPRIYCIPATEAPVVAVFRRGPSNWAHVGRWDLAAGRYEPGAWLGGRIFPRRCEISPDGRFVCYFAHQPSATWAHGDTYVAVSKLPWLTALYAFPTGGTWTRGFGFSDDKTDDLVPGLPAPYRLRRIPSIQFANERCRGWIEAEDSPPRKPHDAWDERRNARMRKPQPNGDRTLCVESIGWAGGEFGVDQSVDGLNVRYSLESDPDLELLDDVQWADWTREGQLLVATRSGRLQTRNLVDDRHEVVFDVDLSDLDPTPTPAPAWAQHW